MTHPHDHHDRLFPAEAAAKLDDPARLERQPPKAIVDALALRPGCRVVDFGAGTGYYAIPIAQRLQELGEHGRVYALDSQRLMLELLEAKLREMNRADIEPRLGSVDAMLAMDPESADRVLMANVVHEVPDRAVLFGAAARVLAPDGMVLVVDWHPEGSTEHGPPLDHRLRPEEVSRYLMNAGFSELEALPCYPDHFVLRAYRR
ncbi:MAG: class I SAM-dependent methyltransferase [Myxococcota bacterium]